jgi:hypothetical protein
VTKKRDRERVYWREQNKNIEKRGRKGKGIVIINSTKKERNGQKK